MKSPFSMDLTGQHLAAPVASLSRSGAPPQGGIVPAEIIDLRKRPIYEAPALPLTYDRATDNRKPTTALPIGTQAGFIAAAEAAARAGQALNTLLTLRWSSLLNEIDGHWLAALSVPDRIDRLVERLRKWLGGRGVPASYIWVREAKGEEDEHWHLAFHLPMKHRRALAAYIGEITDEPAVSARHLANRTEGEFAVGEQSNWHLAKDTRPDREGYYLAAYLGKGEPSERLFRGRLRNNDKKPVRGRRFGGDRSGDKYDSDQGFILGTRHRGKRFNICKPLKSKAPKTTACKIKKGHWTWPTT